MNAWNPWRLGKATTSWTFCCSWTQKCVGSNEARPPSRISLPSDLTAGAAAYPVECHRACHLAPSRGESETERRTTSGGSLAQHQRISSSVESHHLFVLLPLRRRPPARREARWCAQEPRTDPKMSAGGASTPDPGRVTQRL